MDSSNKCGKLDRKGLIFTSSIIFMFLKSIQVLNCVSACPSFHFFLLVNIVTSYLYTFLETWPVFDDFDLGMILTRNIDFSENLNIGHNRRSKGSFMAIVTLQWQLLFSYQNYKESVHCVQTEETYHNNVSVHIVEGIRGKKNLLYLCCILVKKYLIS